MKIDASKGARPHHAYEWWLYILITLSLGSAVILSFISWMRVCSETCAEGHNFRIMTLPFELLGIPFFIFLIFFHLLSWHNQALERIRGWMISLAVGAELWFIVLQKFTIGSWCPICLGIAASVIIAAILMGIESFIHWQERYKIEQQGTFMSSVQHVFSSFTFAILGFCVAFFGVSKVDQLHAAESAIKQNLTFGDKSSAVEVYLFTDWQCPSCRELEPAIVKMSPVVMQKAKVFFVDYAIHPETMNFTPYNLAFMLKNKSDYLDLRAVLTQLSTKTATPNDEMIGKEIKHLGVRYNQLNYADVALGIKYFKQLGKQFNIHSTPTMVILNTATKKGKRLTGPSEITEANVIAAIRSLKN